MKNLLVNEASYTLDHNQITYEAFDEKTRIELDENAKDFCVGKYGDGCGGGRIFVLYEAYVKVYEFESDEVVLILEGLKNSKNIFKEACRLSIETPDKIIYFNLSTMTKEDNEHEA